MLCNNCLVYWSSKKQGLRAQSVFEAETIAGNLTCRQVLFLRKILNDFVGTNHKFMRIQMFGDNEKSIECAMKDSYGKRSKHFDVKHFFLADGCQDGIIELFHILSENNPADLLTKIVTKDLFFKHIQKYVKVAHKAQLVKMW